MIEAKDLRIGNILMGHDKGVFTWDYEHFKWCSEGFFADEIGTPIPLTEEWLLRFGFVKNKNTFILNKDASVTHEKTGSESGFWYSNDESDAHCYRLKKIEFVHQLQNLFFSLCGEELNVKQL